MLPHTKLLSPVSRCVRVEGKHYRFSRPLASSQGCNLLSDTPFLEQFGPSKNKYIAVLQTESFDSYEDRFTEH